MATDVFSTIPGLLTLSGLILFVAGAALMVLGIITRTRRELVHQNRRLVLDPNEPVSTRPDGTINYLRYLNVMLPLSDDAEISGRIQVISGNLKFRIVGYFGFPAPLGHGKWVSNIFYPEDREFLPVSSSFELPKLRLLRRDYVCEFRVFDDNNPQPFAVDFTAIAERKRPLFKYSEGAKDLGRLIVPVAIALIVVGISMLLRA